MRLPFLDRESEQLRLRNVLAAPEDGLACLYGRRRCGKSRLIVELLRDRPAVYYVGDSRDAALQIAAVAREVARLLPSFDDVTYPGWEPLLRRWWDNAPAGAVLAFDEFPWMVSTSPELPSLLQKLIDVPTTRRRKTILCGSSQRMMQGLLLDASAPLYGRAREILKLEPLDPSWLRDALGLAEPERVVEHFAVWGGVPRYWELAADYEELDQAVRELVLDPMGVLHREPERLLLDDHREVARAASLLALVGRGCHRVSEIGGRLGRPATSLTRPIGRLVELGLLGREVPFGRTLRDTKRTSYHIADPFLRWWYRFVEPNRSRLAAGAVGAVQEAMAKSWSHHLASVWEDLVRRSVGRDEYAGRRWWPGSRWWGTGTDGRRHELDLVTTAIDDPSVALVGEVKSSLSTREVPRILQLLHTRASACPELAGKRLELRLWVLSPPSAARDERVSSAEDVVG